MENVETNRQRIERLRKGIREMATKPEPTNDIDQYTKINIGVYPYYLWMRRNADSRRTSNP